MKPLNVLNAVHFGVFTTVLAASGPDQKPFLSHASADRAEVSLPSGIVIGSVVDGVEAFRGIPYAKPPEADLRLEPPVRREADLGHFDATGPGPSCPQFGSFIPGETPGETPVLGGHGTGQEDCLTITVQRPVGVSPDRALPVLFWIYGGAFQFGSTEDYNATDMLKAAVGLDRPFIFVAANYRMGGFGFLGGREILAEGSANLGLLDQRMALEWTADNIAYFGGDPSKVVIWGESAGAISVVDQLALFGGDPVYKGEPLFRGAIVNSGNVLPTDPVDCGKAQAIFDDIVEKLECSDANDKLKCLRAVGFEDFHTAVNSVPSADGITSLALSYLPRPDVSVLPVSPDVAFEGGDYHAVPMIIGNQEDEGTLFAREEVHPDTTNAIVDYLQEYYFHNSNTEQITKLVNTWPNLAVSGSPFRTNLLYRRYAGYKRLSALLGDVVFILLRRLTLSFATTANKDIPIWSYMSSYLHDATGISGNDQGTFHATDVFYGMFGLSNVVDLPGLPKLPYPIAQTRKYYLNFLYNLDPNKGLPVAKRWPTWEERNPKLLRFNILNIVEINDDFREKSYDFIKENRADLYA
ncbi:hypothetical protein NQ176_g6709 [Zarea fungicola]|uniref:Uncharacterized protein n=1 Tax=Zarea fungicola TaxID=93591 RepID=A0ACC1N337_9HYPO|nr:hypothetical protein NQ176_g6709 [Lecanicillium fungicola]